MGGWWRHFLHALVAGEAVDALVEGYSQEDQKTVELICIKGGPACDYERGFILRLIEHRACQQGRLVRLMPRFLTFHEFYELELPTTRPSRAPGGLRKAMVKWEEDLMSLSQSDQLGHIGGMGEAKADVTCEVQHLKRAKDTLEGLAQNMPTALREFYGKRVPAGKTKYKPLGASEWDDATLHASGKPMRQWRDGRTTTVTFQCVRDNGGAAQPDPASLEHVRDWLRGLLDDPGFEVHDDFYRVLGVEQRQADGAKGSVCATFEVKYTQTGRNMFSRDEKRNKDKRKAASENAELQYTHGDYPAWSDFELRTMDVRDSVIEFQLTSGNRAPEGWSIPDGGRLTFTRDWSPASA